MDIVKDVPPGKQNIIIRMSGGADSSIIYYALCKKFADNNDVNIYVVTLNTDKKPFYVPTARKIIKVVGELTGKYPKDHITISIEHNDVDYSTVQESVTEDLRVQLNAIHVYTGITKNPPIEKMKKYFKDNYLKYNLNLKDVLFHIDDRDKERDSILYSTYEGTSVNPFGNSDKKTVAAAYEHYGVTEALYPHTRSCEDFTVEDIDTQCGHCFFCAERIWGFGRLK